MLPTLPTRSVTNGTASTWLSTSNGPVMANPKLAKLDKIEPPGLRDEYLRNMNNQSLSRRVRIISFNNLILLTPIYLRKLFRYQIVAETGVRDKDDNEIPILKFFFNGVELTQIPLRPRHIIPFQIVRGGIADVREAVDTGEDWDAREVCNASEAWDESEAERAFGSQRARLRGANHYNLPSIFLKLTYNRLEWLPSYRTVENIKLNRPFPLYRMFGSTYVVWCVAKRLIGVDYLTRMADKIDTYFDFNLDPFDFTSNLLHNNFKLFSMQMQTIFLDNFGWAFNVTEIKQFANFAMWKSGEDGIPFYDFLVFARILKDIVDAWGLSPSALTAKLLIDIWNRKVLLSNLTQIKKYLSPEESKQLTLQAVLDWRPQGGEAACLNFAFSTHPELVRLMRENKVSVMFIAGLSPSEFASLTRCIGQRKLLDLLDRGKATAKEMIHLTDEKFSKLMECAVPERIFRGEFTVTQAVTMSDWQKENLDNPLVRFSTVFTSMFL